MLPWLAPVSSDIDVFVFLRIYALFVLSEQTCYCASISNWRKEAPVATIEPTEWIADLMVIFNFVAWGFLIALIAVGVRALFRWAARRASLSISAGSGADQRSRESRSESAESG